MHNLGCAGDEEPFYVADRTLNWYNVYRSQSRNNFENCNYKCLTKQFHFWNFPHMDILVYLQNTLFLSFCPATLL